MESVAQQGARANRHGRTAGDIIADTLTRRSVLFQREVAVGQSIFESVLRVDFRIDPTPRHQGGFIIESKWQEVKGSAEEKICFIVENCRAGHYSAPVVVVIDGAGFRAGALRWLRSCVGQGNLFAVFSLVEFLTWCNRSL